jgi:hypothetical protein
MFDQLHAFAEHGSESRRVRQPFIERDEFRIAARRIQQIKHS